MDFCRDGGRVMRASLNGALRTWVTGLSIDSRTIAPGEAYFAIKGEVHDGHEFVAAALKAGAALAVIETAQREKLARRMRRYWRWRTCSPVSSISPAPRARVCRRR